MKLVLDANVLVSGFAARGLCSSLVEICFRNHEVYFSARLLEELKKALLGPMGVPLDIVGEALSTVQLRGRRVDPLSVPPSACRDKDDLHVLGLSAAAGAEFLVTGDKDLLVLKRFLKTRILSPRELWPSISM